MPEDQTLDSEPSLRERAGAKISEQFGFIEPPELRQLHEECVELLRLGSTEQFREAIGRYHDAAAAVVDAADDEHRPHLQTGVMLATAEIQLRAGNSSRFLEDLRDAIIYARRLSDQTIFHGLESVRKQLEDDGVEAPVTEYWIQDLAYEAMNKQGLDADDARMFAASLLEQYKVPVDEADQIIARLEFE